MPLRWHIPPCLCEKQKDFPKAENSSQRYVGMVMYIMIQETPHMNPYHFLMCPFNASVLHINKLPTQGNCALIKKENPFFPLEGSKGLAAALLAERGAVHGMGLDNCIFYPEWSKKPEQMPLFWQNERAAHSFFILDRMKKSFWQNPFYPGNEVIYLTKCIVSLRFFF